MTKLQSVPGWEHARHDDCSDSGLGGDEWGSPLGTIALGDDSSVVIDVGEAGLTASAEQIRSAIPVLAMVAAELERRERRVEEINAAFKASYPKELVEAAMYDEPIVSEDDE